MSNGQKGQMPDLNALMKQAQKLQGDVAKVQEELAAMTCEGTAGGGLWKTGDAWNTGIPLQPDVLRANVRYSVRITTQRTDA